MMCRKLFVFNFKHILYCATGQTQHKTSAYSSVQSVGVSFERFVDAHTPT